MAHILLTILFISFSWHKSFWHFGTPLRCAPSSYSIYNQVFFQLSWGHCWYLNISLVIICHDFSLLSSVLRFSHELFYHTCAKQCSLWVATNKSLRGIPRYLYNGTMLTFLVCLILHVHLFIKLSFHSKHSQHKNDQHRSRHNKHSTFPSSMTSNVTVCQHEQHFSRLPPT